MLSDWLRNPLDIFKQYRAKQRSEQLGRLRARYQIFRALLDDNHRAVELLTDLSAALRSPVFWPGALARKTSELIDVTSDLVEKLDHLARGKFSDLVKRHSFLATQIRQELAHMPKQEELPTCLPLNREIGNMVRVVGGKAANLARLQQRFSFQIPKGFVVPVSACRLFLEHNDLYLNILARLREAKKNDEGLPVSDAVETVKKMILAAPLPKSLSLPLNNAASPLFAEGKGLAVRSSAVSEDTASHSFAGQYVSVLNVTSTTQLEEAFKTVVASAFSERNLAYRKHGGLAPYEFDLAVLCLEMVNAKAAGILFTTDPNFGSREKMLISAVLGLGELVVGGSEAADIYRPLRDASDSGVVQIAEKSRRLVNIDNGGVAEEQLDSETSKAPVLSPTQVLDLVHLGLDAEEELGGPLDIEWAIDSKDKFILLQARPLKVAVASTAETQLGVGRKPLMSGGQSAFPGRGAGLLKIVRTRQDLDGLDDPPYVLAMHQSLVEAVESLRKVNGLLIDLGNPADHLSCVAREYEIPMLTGLGNATTILKDGDPILVDGQRGAIFKATPEELARHRELHQKKTYAQINEKNKPADPATAALHDLIVPLNLTDAYGPTFTIAECRSLHDLVRYAHEKAVLAMFEAGDEALEQSSGAVSHLESDVPFFVSVIDLGGGLLPDSGRRIKVEQILSRPFTALWQGVTTPGLNWGPTGDVNVGTVMSRFMSDHRSARPIGMPNYALVTRDFLNLNARMDFHFTMVDSICGHDARLNYIKFRFKGGGTGFKQRCRRVRCLAEIMSSSGFFCDLRDDLLTSSIQGGNAEILEEKLRIIGRLLGFSRLLDAVMRKDDLISKVAKAFYDGDYQLQSLTSELANEDSDMTQK